MPARSSRRPSRGALAAVALVVALPITACKPETAAQPLASPPSTATEPTSNGLADKSPQAILAAVGTALRGAKSVHMKGSTVDGRDVIAVDMTLTQSAGTGKIRGPINGKRPMMQIIATGGRIYFRGPQLWQAVGGQAAAQRIGNRWVVSPKESAPDTGFLTLAAFAKEVLKPKGRVVKGKPATIAGQPVIALIDSGDRSVLYIATTGKPYPLRMTQARGKNRVDFDSYDAPVTITGPPNALDFETAVGG